jgi:hypothetical protein
MKKLQILYFYPYWDEISQKTISRYWPTETVSIFVVKIAAL